MTPVNNRVEATQTVLQQQRPATLHFRCRVKVEVEARRSVEGGLSLVPAGCHRVTSAFFVMVSEADCGLLTFPSLQCLEASPQDF